MPLHHRKQKEKHIFGLIMRTILYLKHITAPYCCLLEGPMYRIRRLRKYTLLSCHLVWDVYKYRTHNMRWNWLCGVVYTFSLPYWMIDIISPRLCINVWEENIDRSRNDIIFLTLGEWLGSITTPLLLSSYMIWLVVFSRSGVLIFSYFFFNGKKQSCNTAKCTLHKRYPSVCQVML